MKFTALFLCLFLISCNKSDDKKTPTPTNPPKAPVVEVPVTPEAPPVETSEPTPLPPEVIPVPEIPEVPVEVDPTIPAHPSITWDADVYFVNFTDTQKAKVEEAISLMKLVIEGDEFKEAVLNHMYNSKKSFLNNNGLTNEQIYQKILDGAETLNKEVDNEMDVELELYYASTTTIGYTYSNSKRIWMNTKYFNTYTPSEVSSNLMHEWLHKLGFTHSSNYTSIRKYSVPYAIGYIMGSLARNVDK